MTARRKRADPASSASSMVAAMQAPAAQSFAASQRLAFEAARFWARRMRSYADQMETLATCTDPNQAAAASARFFEQMRADYAAEAEIVRDLWRQPEDSAGAAEGREA
jgi:hypothetical protein